jgi:hypothetical protein
MHPTVLVRGYTRALEDAVKVRLLLLTVTVTGCGAGCADMLARGQQSWTAAAAHTLIVC